MNHECHPSRPLTRRQMLMRAANGFGAVALTSLMSEKAYGAKMLQDGGILSARHHKPKATSVIFLYMDGGPSQVDTFDPKPRLDRDR